MSNTFEFELTDSQIEKIEDVRKQVDERLGSYVVVCQLYLPAEDYPNIKKPTIKGKAYYDDDARFIADTIKILKGRNQ